MLLFCRKKILNEKKEALIKLIGSKECAQLSSVALIDSHLTQECLAHLQKALLNPKCTLSALNLKYCFLDLRDINLLKNSITHNRSLVKLDLSSNALHSLEGRLVVMTLRENVFLVDVNLSKNLLGNEFAIALAEVLKINDTLYRC